MSTSRRLLGVLLVASMLSCHGQTPAVVAPAPSPISDRVLLQAKDLPAGLELQISNGRQGPPSIDHAKLAPATKLAQADTDALLGRAAPIAAEPDDQQPFALRPSSLPPPRTGATIHGAFPPAASIPPPATTAKQLHVLRWLPEGKVPIAPQLSVTFDQPMVAVTGQDDAARVQPVTLSPQPKGTWRWLGTRTIVFDPDVRFPMATTYRVTVPAGTKSATGSALAKAVEFSFETPAPQVVSWGLGGEAQPLDARPFVQLDQRIDPAAVLAHVHMTANGQPAAVRAVTADELARDASLGALVASAKADGLDGRWLAVRAIDPLPKDAAIRVELEPGTPSAEGPNVTTAAASTAFRTYAPLRITESSCRPCRPGSAIAITFDNELAVDQPVDAKFTVTPAIADLAIDRYGSFVSLRGSTLPNTSYTVVVSGTTTDRFGQTLGSDHDLHVSIGDPEPVMFGPSGMVVLDPAAKLPTFDVFTAKFEALKVQLYKVQPGDYDRYARYVAMQWDHKHPVALPGTKVLDQLVRIAPSRSLVETQIDLRAALAGGHGDAIAVVEPYPWTQQSPPPRQIAWIQSTKLAIDAHVDADQLVAFASELGTGKPLARVDVELRPYGIHATTDDHGIATLALAAQELKGASYLVATRGDDRAFVLDMNGQWNETGAWFRQPRTSSLRWYVTDDRKLYKPGEQVHLKGWLRRSGPGPHGDVEPSNVSRVTYRVQDATGNPIGAGIATLSTVGGFDTAFTLPKTPNLGTATVTLEAGSDSYAHAFQIEEFRRPEFEVTAKASQGPFVVGGSADVTVTAKYYAGGPLPGAQTRWSVAATPATFTPPNRDDYAFGRWTPWWDERGEGDDRANAMSAPKTWQLAGTTDASGAHVAHLDFTSMNPPIPMSVVASASVADVNLQQWSASAVMLVHPSDRYVGLKLKSMFVAAGTPFDLDVIGVDLDGHAAIGTPIEVKAERVAWHIEQGKIATTRVEPQTCAVIAAKDAAACHFATPKGGTYEVTAVIVDAKGRPNETTLQFWVSGGESPPTRDVEEERVQLVPDQREYAAGDTAHLLVQAPFYPADGVVTWQRDGILETLPIALTGPTATLAVPISDAMVPNLFVHVDLVGAATRLDDRGVPDPALPKRPAFASGTIDLSVPPKQRALAVHVRAAAAKVAPGQSTQIELDVRDAAGRPVADAEVAVIVVDEAVLALAGADFADPIAAFYTHRDANVTDALMRRYVTLAKPTFQQLVATAETVQDETTEAPPGKPMPPPPPSAEPTRAIENKPPSPTPPPATIVVRSNFDALAAFAPAVRTRADGTASVSIKVPDNLTRYRIVAIAAAGMKQFGKGESSLVARLPLMIRPSAPRFLNFGDSFRLPVVVQNQTDAPMTVRVAVRATNAAITDGAGREVRVPANDRVELQFPAAAERAGTARFQIVGVAGTATDAAEVSLPVWTPATTEAFATYGVIDSGAIAQPVALPGKAVPQFGSLEITTASTNLQSLTDALLYLVHYPFECAEQRSSRIAAIAALRDVLEQFQTKDMPSRAALERSVADDVAHLANMQNFDGGFAYWDRGYPSEPYLSVYVANALAHAKAKGFAIPPEVLANAMPYLASIESRVPAYYGADVRHAISAYALYTRKLLGVVDIAKGKKLLADSGGPAKLSMEADGWLLALFAGNAAAARERAELARYAQNRVSETAGAASFTTSYGDGNYLLLASDRRVDAVMLEALIDDQPASDLIPKLVTGLLAHRTAGRWASTQENAFVLLALDRYFQAFEKITPDFVARMWLGADYAGDHAFKGRQTDRFEVAIPLAQLATPAHSSLTLQKDGQGRLYYRIGMTYAPASLQLAPADRGFVVERRYEAVDDPGDVTRQKDGTWHVKAGSRVRVRVAMVNDARRYHVALVDPLPAGFEAMNAALATTGPIPLDPQEQQRRGAYWWWIGPWYEHQNLRDERVEAFASLLWEGVHTYTYVARATTLGTFVVPPPKAEEMYAPETFGRGASDRVIVE